MLLDYALEFFHNHNILDDHYGEAYIPLGTTASQGTPAEGSAVGGNVAAAVGKGQPIYVYARVGTAFDTCDSITINILMASDNAGTDAVTVCTKTILLAALTANSLHAVGMISGAGSGAWITCQVVVTGTNNVAGTLTVGLSTDRDGMPQNDVFSAG